MPGAFVWPIQGTVPGAMFEYHSTMSLSETYTDNFDLTTSAQGRKSNWRTTISPGSTILLNTAKTHGSISATSGFSFDSSGGSSDFNAFPRLTAAIQYAYDPRLSFTVTDSFSRDDNPTVANSTGLQQQRQTFISNSFGASANWLLDLIQTQYYYRNSLFINDEGSSNSTTTTSQTFGLSASTQIGPLNTVRVGYEYSISEPTSNVNSYGNLFTASISHQLLPFASVGIQGSYSMQTLDNVQIWNGSVFGTYGLPAGISFSGSVGYTLLNSDVASNQSGYSGSMLASYAHARGVISIGVFQDYSTTYQGGQFGQTGQDITGQNFGVVQQRAFTANFTYQLTPIISSYLQASLHQNTNTGIGNTKSNTSQDYFTASAGINWPLLRWLTLSFQYSYNQYNQPDRTQNNGTVTLSAAF